jgi:hypothetical protein
VSVLWVLPLLFFAAGAVWALSATRQAAAAGALLREECVRLDELRTALVALQDELGATRGTLDRVRFRSVSGETRG